MGEEAPVAELNSFLRVPDERGGTIEGERNASSNLDLIL